MYGRIPDGAKLFLKVKGRKLYVAKITLYIVFPITKVSLLYNSVRKSIINKMIFVHDETSSKQFYSRYHFIAISTYYLFAVAFQVT